jgi:hypothetical protein
LEEGYGDSVYAGAGVGSGASAGGESGAAEFDFGDCGVPPIPVDVAAMTGMNTEAATPTKVDDTSKREASSLRSLGVTTKGKAREGGVAAGRLQAASPMRKRSWQQIHRALEFESARKKERPGNTDDGRNELGIARIRA